MDAEHNTQNTREMPALREDLFKEEPASNEIFSDSQEHPGQQIGEKISPVFDDDFIIDKMVLPETAPSPESANPAPHRTARKKKRNSGGYFSTVIWVVLILGASITLALGCVFAMSDYMGIGKSGTSTVDIPQGANTTQIAKALKEAGAIRYPFLFRLYSKLEHTDGKYQYGLYAIRNEGGYSGIASQLQKDGAKAETVTVTIPEQAEIDAIIDALVEAGVTTKADFKDAMANDTFDNDFVDEIPIQSVYYRLEGYLFPDTYDFYVIADDPKEAAHLAIQKMLNRTAEKFSTAELNRAAEMGYSMHEILTMASIVELEASGKPEEMCNVAAVFYNRLQWDEPKMLGSSPTADYPYGNGRYNTNKNEGLPPGPLCAPSADAIQAALYPTENFSYCYFVTDSEMQFYYNNTLKEHESTIARLKSQGKWA